MSTAIRRARAEDRTVLLELRRELYDGDPDGEFEIDPLLADPLAAVFVLEVETGRLCGFVEVGLRSFAEGCVTSPVGYIEGLWVDLDQRRRGHARALLGAAEQWAIEQGCREMGSDVRIDNTISELTHVAAGYEPVERIICFRKSLPAQGC